MAVKKRTTLRAKSLKKVGAVSSVSEVNKKEKLFDKIAAKSEENVKQHTLKSNSVGTNISRDPNEAGISKSAIRRRKRKLRDQLRPKLTEDLLDALTESTNTRINVNDKGEEELIIEEKVKLDHTPNPLNKRGEMALFKIEKEEFKNVLKSDEFRKGGLSGLRDSILKSITREG